MITCLITSTCCERQLKVPKQSADHIREGTTYDCPNPECDKLMVFLDSEGRNMSFHQWMHDKNPSWPKDGANTGYVEI